MLQPGRKNKKQNSGKRKEKNKMKALDLEKNPLLTIFWAAILAVVIAVAVVGFGYVLGLFGEAAQVANEEFGPKAALTKYEWFIDQAAMIKKMDQDIGLFEERVKNVDSQYATYGEDRAKWPPHIQTQFNSERQQAREDLLAVITQRNGLVREYNAASVKFNWTPFQTRPDKPTQSFFEYRQKAG
jgi:hypothetical protein